MVIVPPILIDNSKLNESNIPEFEIPQWVSTTAYVRNDEVTYNNNIYVSVIPDGDTSTGDIPDADVEIPKWSKIRPSNRFAPFDGKIGTQSKASYSFMWNGVEYNGIYFKVSPNEVFTSLTLFGLFGSRLLLKITDPLEGVIVDKEIQTISTSGIADWYAYFFEPIELRSDLYEGDLPAYRTASIEIGIVAPEGQDAELSAFLVGREIELGCARFGLRFGITDFSVKNTNEFGMTDITKRGFSKRSSFDIRVEKGKVDFLQKTLAKYRATPIIYRILSEFESTLIYGFYRDFEVVLPGLDISRCSLEIEGLNEI